MRIPASAGLNGAFLFIRNGSGGLTPAPPARDASTDLHGLLKDLRRLQRALEPLSSTVAATGRRPDLPAGAVGDSLSISTETTAAKLSSVEQVNTEATSYTPFGPSFQGSSTSLPTLTGVYAGSTDDDLTFNVTQAGIVGGALPIEFEVRDAQEQLVETVTVPGLTPPDTPIALANGLELSLGSGTVILADAFDVSVSVTTPSAVDPDKPFDGTRNDRPGFENGLQVSAGSFDVNGVTIPVLANDTINSIVAKITASAAGVTSTFDAATERIEFVHDTPGAAGTIDLENDTSGFLAATKLAGATLQAGTDDETAKTISLVPALSGISAGNFLINGVPVTVDPSSDSLDDVVARINGSGTGATAQFDDASRRLRITADEGDPLSLDDGTSGFFSALGVTPGAFEIQQGQAGLQKSGRYDLLEGVLALEDAINDAFERSRADAPGLTGILIRSTLAEAIRSAAARDGDSTAGLATLSNRFGLAFDLNASTGPALQIDRAELLGGLRDDPSRVLEFLAGARDGEGLLATLDEAIDDARDLVLDALGGRGVHVDLYA